MDKELIKKWLGSGSIDIFGLPFAGKDTQGRILADIFDGVLISGGDVLRHNNNQQVQQIMASGGIIPSELFEQIVVPVLTDPSLEHKPLILSEVGRLPGEEQVTMRVTQSSGHPLKAVIVLNLSDKEVWRRFDKAMQQHDRGHRADDRREVLQTRLDKFKSKVTPVINFYRQNNLLIEIGGSSPPEVVTEQILKGLLDKAQALGAGESMG